MGFAVCHIQKGAGNDAPVTAHIGRRVHPANADQSREYLNEQLVDYPEGVEDRTAAIQHRIDTAGITRKISHNQVRALRVMLSGTHEDMQRIEAAGQLDEWCADSLKWLQDTFGKDNVVSADLHRDEKTPHIHATIVPIVSGEKRIKPTNKPTDPNKRTYRKKPASTVRLCADDVMTRDNLERFQDTYAERMAKYGLERGIRGSEARHITTQQYYRDLHAKNEDLRADIAHLEEHREEVTEQIQVLHERKDEAQKDYSDLDEYHRRRKKELEERERQALARTEQAAAEKQQAETALADKQSELQRVKGELKTEKFKNTAAETGTKLANAVGSLLGSSKIDRQQDEITALKAENYTLSMQLNGRDSQIRTLRRDHESDIERLQRTHDRELSAKQTELDRIAFWFPDIPQLAVQADYCREVGFSEWQTVELLKFKPVQFTGTLRSPKSGRDYEADNVTARLEKRHSTSGSGFTLTINGTPILQWFKQQFEKLKQVVLPQQNRGRGIG